MKVCLVGTSNSLFKDGYAQALKDDRRVDEFIQYSIGSSTSIILPYFLSEIDFSRFDVVLFETAINDRNYYIYKSVGKQQLFDFLEWGIEKALKAGCKVGLVVMPTLGAFEFKTISWQIYKRLASVWGVAFIDGFEYARLRSSFVGCEIRSLFKDKFHFKPNVAYSFGHLILDFVLEATPTARTLKRVPKFSVVSLSKNAGESTLQRKNSLFEVEFAVIDEGDSIKIEIPKNMEVVGVSYNAAKSVGCLKISSDKTCIKSLTSNYVENGKDLLLIVVPFTSGGIMSNDGYIDLSLANSEDIPTEPDRFGKFDKNSLGCGHLEVEKLVLMER